MKAIYFAGLSRLRYGNSYKMTFKFVIWLLILEYITIL